MSLSQTKTSVLSNLPQPEPKPCKSDRTREAILEAALEFLWTHPFRDMTVSRLMQDTGLSRSAFYKYFDDAYDLIETLLRGLAADVFRETSTWFEGDGEPLEALHTSLTNLVQIAYDRGPILRAVSDAATGDERLEQTWKLTLAEFDDAITARIEQQQQDGLIPRFPARPVAMALNRMDVANLINAFGRRPRSQPQPVLEALFRIWSATLYAEESPGPLRMGRPV